ncbi:MAG: hypothetical protein LBP59_00155 [Planctomycetaceae bacterium]|nr:hypothetical protein [Planctomycetaceae bacterium]
MRQIAGGTPAIRWSRLHHRIAGVTPASGCTQPLMSEIKISTAFFVCLAAKCRRDARDPAV